MRVTHLASSGELGGAERVLLECVRALPGATSSVVSLGSGGLIEAARRLGAHAQAVSPPPELAGAGDAFGAGLMIRNALPIAREFPGFFSEFSRALASQAPDLVHSHGIKTHVLGALATRRVPLIWHLHDYVGLRSVSSKVLRLVATRPSLVVAVSESVATDARSVLPSSLPVHVIHNGVDVERFRPDGPSLDLDVVSGLLPATEGTLRIGLPATFAKWKGHDVFLDAIARLGRPDVRAYIIGGPVYQTLNSQWSRTELEDLAQDRGLTGRVGFTGLIADMPAAYRSLDIVVHASTRPEPFGLVIAEAMACGCAVVAAPEGGSGELFADGVNALASSGGDATTLASVLTSLIEDPGRRRALGAEARTQVVRSFSTDRFARAMQQAVAGVRSGARAVEFV